MMSIEEIDSLLHRDGAGPGWQETVHGRIAELEAHIARLAAARGRSRAPVPRPPAPPPPAPARQNVPDTPRVTGRTGRPRQWPPG
ncbi:hypothetical protein [Streptomyces sp. PR69]|uniref:hypothetical protein n=1 Tax=Streptomyces sp. PR69 TaxID=2984950 RepID=UPI002B27077B|nr:hypothetical protein [Streptomyces sp. PR69]